MTPTQPDEPQGTLAPGAALTIAAILLGGANEQSLSYFTQLLTQLEREPATTRHAANAGDETAERHVPYTRTQTGDATPDSSTAAQ